MRVVLDTNVIIAAFAARGLCAEIFEVCLAEDTIIISEHILAEVQEKLTEKINLPDDTVKNIIEYLRDMAELFEPEQVAKSACRDKDDIKIIGTALRGNVDFIITGDNDLLALKQYEEVKIITPRQYWDFLRSKRSE
ncbi:MAG: putative toxin-antitoxin system toxin component, PIN family [Deltaproteobacteria bacterium]|nr:putative toxin-antitoxin system toxin component, PIN family [Deltaproteobacteria bacterium]